MTRTATLTRNPKEAGLNEKSIKLLHSKSKTLPSFDNTRNETTKNNLFKRVPTKNLRDNNAAKYIKTSITTDQIDQLKQVQLYSRLSNARDSNSNYNPSDSGLEEASASPSRYENMKISSSVSDFNLADKFCEFLSEDTCSRNEVATNSTSNTSSWADCFSLSASTSDENSNPSSMSSGFSSLLNSKIFVANNNKAHTNSTPTPIIDQKLGKSPLPKPLVISLQNLKKPLLESRKRNFDNFRLHNEISKKIQNSVNFDSVKETQKCLDLYKTPKQVQAQNSKKLENQHIKQAAPKNQTKFLKVRASTCDNFTPNQDDGYNSNGKDLQSIKEEEIDTSGRQLDKNSHNKSKIEFLKSIEPKSFIGWSDDANEFLTLQNYMTSLRMTKCKFPKDLNENVMQRHPELENRMRGILLDWLMEVCDCFSLQRSTFYLAQAYLDIFLSRTGKKQATSRSAKSAAVAGENDKDRHPTKPQKCKKISTKLSKSKSTDNCVSKSQLQLLGITCLFVAAKIEEIDPPRLSKFAFITDGACTESDIVLQELTLLQGLNWLTHPVTSYDWLRLYLQTTYFYLVRKKKDTTASKTQQEDKKDKKKSYALDCLEVSRDYIEKQSFTPIVFAQMCQLLDLATLDINCLKYKPHELAASILYHFSSQMTSKRASNLNMNSLIDCVSWLTHKALTLRDFGLLSKPSDYSERQEEPYDYRRVPPSQWYNIQIHESELLGLLEKAKNRQEMVEERSNRRSNKNSENS